mgnify:CR=1 FL=1
MALQVDGRIDPAEWSAAQRVDDFRMTQPLTREPSKPGQRRQATDSEGTTADAHTAVSTSARCFCTRCILLRWAIFRPNTSLT